MKERRVAVHPRGFRTLQVGFYHAMAQTNRERPIHKRGTTSAEAAPRALEWFGNAEVLKHLEHGFIRGCKVCRCGCDNGSQEIE